MSSCSNSCSSGCGQNKEEFYNSFIKRGRNRVRIQYLPQFGATGSTGNTGSQGLNGVTGHTGSTGETGAQGKGVSRRVAELQTDYSFTNAFQVLPLFTSITPVNSEDGMFTVVGSGSGLASIGSLFFVFLKDGIPFGGQRAAVTDVGGGEYRWQVGFSRRIPLDMTNQTFSIQAYQAGGTVCQCLPLTNSNVDSLTMSILYD